MNTIKKSHVKIAAFALIIALAIFVLIYDLYTHAYAGAAFLVMLVLPIIVKRKQLLDKWFGKTPA